MAKPARTFRNRALRNLGSGVSSAANSSASFIGKAAAGVAKWMATDHTGISDAFGRMPKMGFLDSLRYIALLTLAHIQEVRKSVLHGGGKGGAPEREPVPSLWFSGELTARFQTLMYLVSPRYFSGERK